MQTWGAVLIYKLQQYLVQQEMRLAINDDRSHFEKISIPLAAYQQNRINAHEIRLGGKMYDIKSVNLKDGNAELLVINDSNEEKLNEDYNRLLNNNDQQNKKLPLFFNQLLTLVYIKPAADPFLMIPQYRQQAFRLYAEILISHTTGISTPPPRIG